MIVRSIMGVTLALSAASALAQDTAVGAAPYCADLKRVASLASARDRKNRGRGSVLLCRQLARDQGPIVARICGPAPGARIGIHHTEYR